MLAFFGRSSVEYGVLLVAALAVSIVLRAGPGEAVQLQNWVATAAIRSGNTTLVDTPDPGSPSGPLDSTGLLEANGSAILPIAPPIDAGAVSSFDLANGTIGVSTGFAAEANAPSDARIFEAVAGASALYLDDLTVTSSTLPIGTPVTVRFAFALAFTSDATSTIDLASAASTITSTANGVQGIAPAANRLLTLLETGTQLQLGLFLPPYEAEYTVGTFVGSTFQFALSLDADSDGTVRPLGPPGNVVNAASSGWMGTAVSFGAEVVDADASIGSGLLGGEFPAASAVGAAASEAALPDNPFVVPEPGLVSMLGCGGLICVGLGRIRSRGPSLDR